uniref:Uncharacterized protein n=1 Tax=Tanacetum cinerariifolium TaxID=118510 RepID=A0A6L2JF79_TANCI|nr:hypothetical protein [Tanacetum cinerariifolium]
MLMEEMKFTKHYQLYASAFGIVVPITQSQPIESTQRTHRTPNNPRPPNPVEHQEHLVDEEIEKIVKGNDYVDENKFMNEIVNSQEDPVTRLEPGSHKERPEVEKSVDVLIINDDEDEESARDALIRKKRKGIVEIKDTPPLTPIRSHMINTAPLSYGKEKIQEFMVFDPTPASSKPITSSLKPKTDHKVISKIVDHNTKDFMKNNLPRVVAEAIKCKRQNVKKDIATMVVEAVQKEREKIRAKLSGQVNNDIDNIAPSQVDSFLREYTVDVVHTRDHKDHPDDDARLEGESNARDKRLLSMKRLQQSYMKSHIVWEIKEEDLTLQIPKQPAPYGNTEAKKYVPLLYKIHAFLFPEDDLEELNIISVRNTIKRQQMTRDDPEVVYFESKIVDVVRV